MTGPSSSTTRANIISPSFNFYAETTFGGDFRTEAQYTDPVVQCLIRAGGSEFVLRRPRGPRAGRNRDRGRRRDYPRLDALAPIPYSYNTVNDIGRAAPSPPDGNHILGTDDTARDVAGAGDLWLPAVDPASR